MVGVSNHSDRKRGVGTLYTGHLTISEVLNHGAYN